MNASVMMQDDDDSSSEESVGPFDCGHWIWDDIEDQLKFISTDLPPVEETFIVPTKPDIGKIEFKDDIDVFEQQRFKKRYQRKGELDDVVFLQDIIDVVLYTSPLEILSPSIIKMLHLSVTRTFLRALIFFCQYYLQVHFEMKRRNEECETRIPTDYSFAIEDDLMKDLDDLRLLVAKEYSSMLLGEGAMRHYHHMGPSQTGASLSRKDIGIHKIFTRISIQIVWIALARKFYDQIAKATIIHKNLLRYLKDEARVAFIKNLLSNHLEMEVNRLLVSEVYNSVEHKLKTNYVAMMTPEERHVLFGEHRSKNSKYSIRSPLLDELLSKEHKNYQKFGLGKIQYPDLSERLLYMQRALTAPEPSLRAMNMSVGILGMPRACFDIMLREVKRAHGSSASVSRSRSSQLSRSLSSRISQSSKAQHKSRAYKMIALPPMGSQDAITLPESFPQKRLLHSHNACLREQRQKWLNRHIRLTQKKAKSSKFAARKPEKKGEGEELRSLFVSKLPID